MEREKAWPDTAAPPGRREGESLTSESGGIEYRCGCAGGLARSSGEVPAVAVGVERRGQVIRGMFVRSTGLRSGRSRVSELKSSGKPFEISKAEVWQAWEKVKDNKGAPGVDGCSIEDFEADLKNNLYKIDLEQDVVGELLPATGAGGRNTEAAWRGHSNVRSALRVRSGGPDGGSAETGGEGRGDLPFGLLRLSSWAVSGGCG